MVEKVLKVSGEKEKEKVSEVVEKDLVEKAGAAGIKIRKG